LKTHMKTYKNEVTKEKKELEKLIVVDVFQTLDLYCEAYIG